MTPQHPWWVRALPPVVIIAALVITTPKTYQLGHELLNLPMAAWTSAALPAVVDGYAIAALRFRRDLRWALPLVAVLVAMSVVVGVVGFDAIHVWVQAVMAAAVVCAIMVVIWRVHELVHHRKQQADRAARRQEDAARRRSESPPIKHWPAAPWPGGPEGDATALAWLNSQPSEGRTRPALAAVSGWSRTGQRIRRLVDQASATGAGVGHPPDDTKDDPDQHDDGHGHASTVTTSPSTVRTTAVLVGAPSGHVT